MHPLSLETLPISPVSCPLQWPADLKTKESFPQWLRFSFLLPFACRYIREALVNKPLIVEHLWHYSICIPTATSPTSARMSPQRNPTETLPHFQLSTSVYNHLQLPFTPTSPEVPWRGEPGVGVGVHRIIEGKRLMKNLFDTLLQAKEEKTDWTLMRIISRGAFICSDGPAACVRE